jgi:hypothetical protein
VVLLLRENGSPSEGSPTEAGDGLTRDF